MTPDQFTASFGPTVQDYQTVSNFAVANSLTIVSSTPTRQLLTVQGTVSSIERAFGIHLLTYQHPTEARQFFAPDVGPTIDPTISILDIAGLTDYPKAYRMHAEPQLVSPNWPAGWPNFGGSGPDGSIGGNDFHVAYAKDSPQFGTGQVVGLLEFDGYDYAITASYLWQTMGVSKPVPQVDVYLDNFNGVPGPNESEVEGDIEVASAMATNLSNITVFEGNPSDATQSVIDILHAMVQSNQIHQFSSSWSLYGISSQLTCDQYLEQMAVQGQSFFQASGDSNAYTSASEAYPPFSPYVTSVGGTTLYMANGGQYYGSETAWNFLNEGNEGVNFSVDGTSGGYNTAYTIPWWQTGAATSANQGSTAYRMIPDVSAVADAIFLKTGTQTNGAYFWGTSFAAPVWASYTALANEWAHTNGLPTVGFLNPALYNLGFGQPANFQYSDCMRDITTGNNEWSGSPYQYSAVAGYDLCTGWGTPHGTNLMEYLTISDAGRGLDVLQNFSGAPGAAPAGGLVLPGAYLYGTTVGLGNSQSCGSVFKICTNGTGFANLHTFAGSDGSAPYGDLFVSGSTLYGTTSSGGASGDGTIFAVDYTGSSFTTIYNFGGGADGSAPQSGVVLSGNTLYGAASGGGSAGYGTVYSVTTSGSSFTTLHKFNNADGSTPVSTLLLSGNVLYGTTKAGGSHLSGTIFSIKTDGTGFTTLHAFNNSDGVSPQGKLLLPGSKLYGTTYSGGAHNRGTVFSLNTDGTGFTTLYNFGTFAPYDGEKPAAGLVVSGQVFYGTTSSGGYLEPVLNFLQK